MLIRVYGYPADKCKGIFQVHPTSLSVKNGLRNRIDLTSQRLFNPRRPSGRAGKTLRQQECLIETTFAFFPRMKRHRHKHGIARQLQHSGHVPDRRFDVGQRIKPAVIFQLMHERPRRAFEKHTRTPFSKRRRQSLAMRTHPLARQFTIKRMPAN